MTTPRTDTDTTRTGRAPGLHDAALEHDNCGVAAVARLDGEPRHEVVERALVALDNLEHRGAAGADPTTGDGAGILLQLPHDFLRERAGEFGLGAEAIPEPGRVAVAMCFMPADGKRREELSRLIAESVEAEGQLALGWREVPVVMEQAGDTARTAAPVIRQLLVGAGPEVADQDAFERKLFVIRRTVELATDEAVHFPSFSSRTIVYKGMLTAPQLAAFFEDLRDPALTSALAIVHSRFSTNTFPSWKLAHPHRYFAHNGEINTLTGNVNWMRAREATFDSPLFGEDLRRCLPLIRPGTSDSAAFDHALELLVLGGRSLPHALMMMIPRAWQAETELSEELKGFYRYHACLMEPWDGPVAGACSDGRILTAMLDRNGLRPGRWVVTRDGWVVLGSETGVLPVPPELVERRGRLHPGRLFIADLEQGRVLAGDEAEAEVARRRPYAAWHAEQSVHLDDLPPRRVPHPDLASLRARQLAFGYSQEDLRVLLAPSAADAKEPTGSMGNDLALAVLSDREPSLFSYFKQRFAQVTNPAIDPVREELVMSLTSLVGSENNLLDETPEHALHLELDQPILTGEDLERIRLSDHSALRSETLDITWPLSAGVEDMEGALAELCDAASGAVSRGCNLLVLSDREIGPERVPIPSLLAVAAVHHHLVREGTRLRTGLVVESGEPREVHHMAALIGYGASAVNPYLMLDSLDDLHGRAELAEGLTPSEARERVITALDKGLLKVISKMGIATIQSYCGAQVFEAVGLDRELIDRHFTGTTSRVGGVGLDVLAHEALERHARAWPERHGRTLPEHVEDSLLPAGHIELLPQGGVYAWRRDGERHMWDPETISSLQHAARSEDEGAEPYERFSEHVNRENAARGMLRGLMRMRSAGPEVPLAEVEPATEIVKRFCTGGMSLGALSTEAHEALAVAMNRLGGMSNSGEGGEDRRRNEVDHDGNLRRSRIRQVASGRFGVTADYLAVADQLQIKISQGSKPGEGGQLPGHKVDDYIAELRFSTPGVGLISPPPHHDIYSIEDLKQLIYDLRAANPAAAVSVKLAAEVGVGTVAAGVSKAGADHVVIAGHDGGTGASPLSSIQFAGVPWELGLAETQQTLLANELRSRIVVQVDGQMRTGRDVVVGAILGADEFGFSTAPLIATGCIMMRVCHMNTCPVGVATQDPELRRRFAGRPEHVVRYLLLVAEEVRGLMARMGVRSMEELIGRVDLLERDPEVEHWKARRIELDDLLVVPEGVPPDAPRRRVRPPDPHDPFFDDRELMSEADAAIERLEPVRIEREVANVDRAIGGRLSHEIARRHGLDGLPEGTLEISLRGSAGQSFGAWLAPGVEIALAGDANDYVGKGMSGGVLAVHPPPGATFRASESVVIGNVALYGATSGRAFFNGLAGERFAVRNSGAHAVVEGVGDHGCEYMTGGRVVVLGPTGYNFAAGMSGGIAYVHDPDGRFPVCCNCELVDLEGVEGAEAHELRDLIAEHATRTGSEVAARILAEWDVALAAFVKVMPRDYRRVLAERGEAHEERGVTV